MSTSSLISNSNINSKEKLFDRKNQKQISYNVEEVDAVIGYFLKRGFDQIAAVNTALIILEQARKDDVPVFELIDTLKGITDVTLNNVITQILNLNRSRASTLGYRVILKNSKLDQRNIIN